MGTFNKFRATSPKRLWILALTVVITACGTQTARMDFVNQNVAEDRIVSKEAVEDQDILNQYHHDYPAPEKEIGIYVDLDRPRLPVTGGELYAQIGIVARPEKIKPANIHVVIYDETEKSEAHRQFEQEFIKTLNNNITTAGKTSSLSVDTAFKRPDWVTPPGLFAETFSGLESVFKKLAQVDLPQGKNHIILLLGDINRAYKTTRQDLIDIAGLLKVKGTTLSIVTFGEKPDFDLLNTLVKRSAGRLAFKNEFFDISAWTSEELQYIHAMHYTEVQLSIEPEKNVEFLEVVSPKNIHVVNNKIEIKIPEVITGDGLVLLAKLKVPAMTSDIKHNLLNSTLEYFHPEKRQYKKITQNAYYAYGLDKNDCLPYAKGKVARSRLILDTHKTIANTAGVIRQGRNYQAIALLTEQRQRIDKFTEMEDDKELLRDAAVIAKYATNLFGFQDSWFQGFKVWKDTSWDRDRYQGGYR